MLSATPTTIKDEAGNIVQIPGTATVTSSGQYVLPLQSLQNQQIFSVAHGSDSSNGTVSSVQYQVIPQIQAADGQQVQLGFAASSDNGSVNQETGQIQIIPGSNQTIIASGTSSSNIQNILSQTGQVQGVAIGGSSFPGQAQVVANVPLGLPGNIAFVPINSVDLDSLGLSGSQPMTAGINADGHLISTAQAMDSSDTSERTAEQVSPEMTEATTDTDLFVPTSSSSQLPVTIDTTSILEQNANNLPTSTGQVHSSDLQGNYIQASVSDEAQAQNIQVSTAQPIIHHIQLQESQQATSQAQIVQGIAQQTIHGVQAGQGISQQALQNLQLQLNPGTFLIQAQTVTPSGQITWQTFQVQGVQNLQNLQLQNAPGQQITLTPVQTLTLGQVAAGGALTSAPVSLSTAQLPNLQTVTINSIDSGGIQLHQGENADSPAGIYLIIVCAVINSLSLLTSDKVCGGGVALGSKGKKEQVSVMGSCERLLPLEVLACSDSLLAVTLRGWSAILSAALRMRNNNNLKVDSHPLSHSQSLAFHCCCCSLQKGICCGVICWIL